MAYIEGGAYFFAKNNGFGRDFFIFIDLLWYHATIKK